MFLDSRIVLSTEVLNTKYLSQKIKNNYKIKSNNKTNLTDEIH